MNPIRTWLLNRLTPCLDRGRRNRSRISRTARSKILHKMLAGVIIYLLLQERFPKPTSHMSIPIILRHSMTSFPLTSPFLMPS